MEMQRADAARVATALTCAASFSDEDLLDPPATPGHGLLTTAKASKRTASFKQELRGPMVAALQLHYPPTARLGRPSSPRADGPLGLKTEPIEPFPHGHGRDLELGRDSADGEPGSNVLLEVAPRELQRLAAHVSIVPG